MSAIPKFLICWNAIDDPDREYILHTEYPRFIAEVTGLDINVKEWIDSPKDVTANAQELAKLMREAADFWQEHDMLNDE